LNFSLISRLRASQSAEPLSHGFEFLREYWRNRKQTGSVTSSSLGLARAMVEPCWDDSSDQDVLEVGSGTGIISEQIFRRMRATDKLTIVEINLNFLSMTHRKMVQRFGDQALTERVFLVNTDFLQHQMPADHFSRICCSLPFNNFAPHVTGEIFREMFRVCRPGGIIVFYEYILLRRLRYALSLGTLRDLKEIEAVLTNQIREFGIGKISRFSNFPPAMVYILRKPG